MPGHAKLAYSTSTGEQPRSRLARLAAERDLGDNEPAPRIRRTTTAKRPWRRSPRSPQEPQRLDYHHRAPGLLLKAAREAMREGQRLVIVSDTEVRLVNR